MDIRQFFKLSRDRRAVRVDEGGKDGSDELACQASSHNAISMSVKQMPNIYIHSCCIKPLLLLGILHFTHLSPPIIYCLFTLRMKNIFWLFFKDFSSHLCWRNMEFSMAAGLAFKLGLVRCLSEAVGLATPLTLTPQQ